MRSSDSREVAGGELPDMQQTPSTIRANDNEFHYLDQGKGAPVLFVRGGLVDQAVASISCPVLLLSGEGTLEEHRIIDAELHGLIADARRIVIAGATHEMWDEQPDTCREHTLRFLSEHP